MFCSVSPNKRLESRAMASTGTKIYRIFRWVVVIALIAVIAMMLKRPAPAPLAAATVTEKSTEFNAKLEGLTAAKEHGTEGEASFTSEEVNSFIADSTVRAAREAADPNPHPTVGYTVPGSPLEGPPLSDDEIQAALDKTQIAFEGDEVVAQTVVQRYGRDIYVTVRGRLGARDGYLAFTPTGFKIGALSVPVSLVNDRLQEKLAEPENHEKMKLPTFIADLRVENGELKIKEK